MLREKRYAPYFCNDSMRTDWRMNYHTLGRIILFDFSKARVLTLWLGKISLYLDAYRIGPHRVVTKYEDFPLLLGMISRTEKIAVLNVCSRIYIWKNRVFYPLS